MDIEKLPNIKIEARELQADLMPTDGKVSYQKCLHTIAKQYGFKDFHHASSYAKENNIDVLDCHRISINDYVKERV